MTVDLLGKIPAGAIVTVDTAPIIYFLQDHPVFAPVFAPVTAAAAGGGEVFFAGAGSSKRN